MVEAKQSWTRLAERGARPFTTMAQFRRADGAVITWESRLYRKHHNLLDNHRGTTWWAPGAIGWWTAGLNLAGSGAFGVSAVAAYVIVDSGRPVNAELANAGTFVGAVCFLVGAFLLLPERTFSTE